MKKIISVITLSIVVIVFFLGFIDRDSNGVFNVNADIVYSINSIPDNLRTVANLDKRQQDIICAVSKGLIEVDSDGNIRPALAECVDITDEGIQYTFKIRDDVYWSDGSKITADDIVMFFKEVILEENQEDIDGLLNVYGVREYINSNNNFNNTVAIYADNNQLIMRLNSKDDDFIYELAKPQYRVRKNVLNWEFINSNYGSMKYSGDYSITSINDEEVILTRNIKANEDLPKVIHIVEDKSEDLALAAFEVGNRNIVIDPPMNQLERLKDEGKLITLPSNKSVYLSFNTDDSGLPISGRKYVYDLITRAIEDYVEENNSAMFLAEGEYYREENTDASKLQERKVLSKNDNTWNEGRNVILVAEKTVENKELVNVIGQWFEKNTDILLITRLIDKNAISESIASGYYDVVIINEEVGSSDDVYSIVNEYNSELVVTTWQENDYSIMEDSMFNSYSLVPLLFYNENIAVNEIKNIELDINGNIIFSSIEK